MSHRVSWELEESHGNLKGLMGTWKVSWELEKSHENLVICLTWSHGNLKGFMGT